MDGLRAIVTNPWFTWMVIAVEAIIIFWLLVRKPSQQT